MDYNLRMPVYHLSEDILTRLIFADLGSYTYIHSSFLSLTLWKHYNYLKQNKNKIETSSQVRKYANKYPNKHKTLSH